MKNDVQRLDSIVYWFGCTCRTVTEEEIKNLEWNKKFVSRLHLPSEIKQKERGKEFLVSDLFGAATRKASSEIILFVS